MPLRIIHLLGLVFMVVWSHPRVKVSVEGMTNRICETMPGVALDLERGRGPHQLPDVAKPDFIQKNLYDDVPLRQMLTERWKLDGSES